MGENASTGSQMRLGLMATTLPKVHMKTKNKLLTTAQLLTLSKYKAQIAVETLSDSLFLLYTLRGVEADAQSESTLPRGGFARGEPNHSTTQGTDVICGSGQRPTPRASCPLSQAQYQAGMYSWSRGGRTSVTRPLGCRQEHLATRKHPSRTATK